MQSCALAQDLLCEPGVHGKVQGSYILQGLMRRLPVFKNRSGACLLMSFTIDHTAAARVCHNVSGSVPRRSRYSWSLCKNRSNIACALGINTGNNLFEAINWGSPGWSSFASVCFSSVMLLILVLVDLRVSNRMTL